VASLLYPRTRWVIQHQNEEAVRQLADEIGVSEPIAALLHHRGLQDPESALAFLNIDKKAYYDPYMMRGMMQAVERIHQALQNKEKILVFGDYDADGVTATAIMVSGLRNLGGDVRFYVPNRFTEGYGPNIPALEKARAGGVSLVVTVDTGIAAHEAAEAARLMGLDYIVTDHHEPPPELPDAYVIINPKQPECPYPFKSLCGAGIAFKVIHALMGEAPDDLLDLAAVGTVADLMPLLDENRLIVTKGLKRLANDTRPGLKALMEIAGIHPQAVTEEDIGFLLGPRINAAGRMAHAEPAIELMLSTDMNEAYPLAQQLEYYNTERKAVVDQITSEARRLAEAVPNHLKNVLVIAKEDWHEGVVGIACSRLMESFYRPTLVFSIDPDTGLAKGSARSIEGFNIFEALNQCRDLLLRFGGHAMAAGMTLPAENLPVLAERLNAIADDRLDPEDFVPKTHAEGYLHLEDVTISFIESLEQLAPFGVGNPKPRFIIENLRLSDIRQIGAQKDHLKLLFKKEDDCLDGVAFGKGSFYHHIASDCELAVVGVLTINEWNGRRKPQVMIDDFKAHSWQLFDWRNYKEIRTSLQNLPQNQTLFIYFRKHTLERLSIQDLHIPICFGEDMDNALASSRPFWVLLDLPETEKQITTLFETHPFPERIYAVFYQEETRFFSQLPSREHFKKSYIYLLRKENITMDDSIRELSSVFRWSAGLSRFILDVFSELEFVKIENGQLTVVRDPVKKPITSSKLYQRLREQVKLEETFVLSGRQELKQWFSRFADRQNKPEEAHAGWTIKSI